jgi:hypothetical protein
MQASGAAVDEEVNMGLRTAAGHLDRSVLSWGRKHHLRMGTLGQRFRAYQHPPRP